MATKLRGPLNLSKIDKSLITTNSKGEKVVWVDILENINGEPDQYGNTHTIQLYNPATREKIYLGNFKPQEFGSSAPKIEGPAKEATQEDLPF